MHVVVEVSLFEAASPSAPLSLQTPSRTGTVVVVLDFLQLDNLLSLQNLACSEVQLPSLKVVLLGSLAPLQVLSRMTLSPFAPVATRSALILSVLGNVLLGTPPSLHSLVHRARTFYVGPSATRGAIIVKVNFLPRKFTYIEQHKPLEHFHTGSQSG